MKLATGIVVGAAGIVAAAAIAAGIRSGLVDSDTGESSVEPAVAAPAPVSSGELPIGDVRRLPPLGAGEYEGQLVLYGGGGCRPVIVDLAHIETTTKTGSMAPACSVWVSPGHRTLAMIPPQPGDHEVTTATAIGGSATPSGVRYRPGNTGALTVTDDGDVAACDGSKVILGQDGRLRTVRAFTPLNDGLDERCVTGAIGRRVVRLGHDRRSLVDVVTHRVVRRLATPIRPSIIAIAASPDGLVLIADRSDGTPSGTVYGADGRVVIGRRSIGRDVNVQKVVVSRGARFVALESALGWHITNLATGRAVDTPRGARVTDIAFSPGATSIAEATDAGVVFADVPDLIPRVYLAVPAHAAVWFPPA